MDKGCGLWTVDSGGDVIELTKNCASIKLLA